MSVIAKDESGVMARNGFRAACHCSEVGRS